MRQRLTWLTILAGSIQLCSGIGYAEDPRLGWPGGVRSISVDVGPPPRIWVMLRTTLPVTDLSELAHEIACRERRDTTGNFLSLPITVHLSISRQPVRTEGHVPEDL